MPDYPIPPVILNSHSLITVTATIWIAHWLKKRPHTSRRDWMKSRWCFWQRRNDFIWLPKWIRSCMYVSNIYGPREEPYIYSLTQTGHQSQRISRWEWARYMIFLKNFYFLNSILEAGKKQDTLSYRDMIWARHSQSQVRFQPPQCW